MCRGPNGGPALDADAHTRGCRAEPSDSSLDKELLDRFRSGCIVILDAGMAGGWAESETRKL